MNFSVNILGKTKENIHLSYQFQLRRKNRTPLTQSGSAMIVFWFKRVSQKASAEKKNSSKCISTYSKLLGKTEMQILLETGFY